jgi:CheY-like chemotaxis protein
MTKPGRKILVADDDTDDLELLIEAFQIADPEVKIDVVSLGKSLMDALEASKDALPNLIVLDYNMPDKNAPALLDMLSAHNVFRKIPAVVWSTSNSLLHKAICEQKGALRYFTKPPYFPDIIQHVKTMLGFCRFDVNQD